MNAKKTLAAVLVAAALLGPAGAAAQAERDRWKVSILPYLWFPAVDSTLRYDTANGSQTVNVDVDADTLIGALNFAAMVAGEARKGKWLVATDIFYTDLGSESSDVTSVDFNPGSGPINVATTQLNSGTDTEIKMTIWSLTGGYNVIDEAGGTLDVFGGFRYLYLETRTDWQLTATVTGPPGAPVFSRSGTLKGTDNIWDAIAGVRGRLRVTDTWFVPYYLDAGAGDSDFTWQASLGAGYAFKWGDLIAAYRYLSYDQGEGDLVQELSLGGFGLGANFHF